MSPNEERQRGLTREGLVQAALALINEEKLDGLSMRALADRLQVKASSLYWHVRDRRELLDLLAESILDGVSRPRPRANWQETVLAYAEALRRQVSAQQDAARILLEAPEVLARSDPFAHLEAVLREAGLALAEAADVASMVMTHVIVRAGQGAEPSVTAARNEVASIAIDSGSRGVILRAGPADMQALIRVPHDQQSAAPAVVRGEQVVVRRLRGVGRGQLELNPRRAWRFKVQAPTWNTVLDAGGLDVREIRIDSGAANVECFLPAPRGVVPVYISSGVVNVAIHRPTGSAAIAHVHTGAVKLKLDQFSSKVAVLDVHWQSDGAAEAKDRYELEVSSGVVDFKLDTYTPKPKPREVAVSASPSADPAVSALRILLAGVEARIKASS